MKTKLFMKFPPNVTNTPVTYQLVKKFDLKFNILKAEIDFNLVGIILYDIEGEAGNISDAMDYVRSLGIECDMAPSGIVISNTLCTDCGLCTSVCAINALSISGPDWKLNYDAGKCIGCNQCIPVCPTRAITHGLYEELEA
jgi:MinD superfamily P-loop ATPase